MRFLTSSGCSRTSKPATVAVPAVGGKKQVSIRMVVVLPAPLGPRKPTICPLSTLKEMWSTAVLRAYRLVSSLTVIMVFCLRKQDARSLNNPTSEDPLRGETACEEVGRRLVKYRENREKNVNGRKYSERPN